MKHLMNTKTEKLTRRGFAFLLAMVLMTSAFVPGLTARATEGETPTLESLKPLKDYETAVALLADLDTIAQALPEDAAKEDIKAVYDTVVAAQTDAEALTGDVALTEEKKAEVAAQAATILTYLTEQRGYVPAEPEAQNDEDEDEEDETPTCTCPEGTEGHVEGCVLYVAPCGTCGETGTHKADCATLCTCPEGTEGHLAECPLYICADCSLNQCICGLESAYLLNGAIVYKDYTNTESDAKAITGWNTAVKIHSSVTAEDGTVWYLFVYSNVLKELLNGYHYVKAADTTTLKCTCTPEEGKHAEDCPLYVEPTPYEKAMKELAALEEEAKTLADGLDKFADDYVEKLTAKCDDLCERLYEIANEIADLWDVDLITAEENDAAELKAFAIIDYLGVTYNYSGGVIQTLDQPALTTLISGLTAASNLDDRTYHLFQQRNYYAITSNDIAKNNATGDTYNFAGLILDTNAEQNEKYDTNVAIKIKNVSDLAEWKFESTSNSGEYYIKDTELGKYISIIPTGEKIDETFTVSASFSDTPVATKVYTYTYTSGEDSYNTYLFVQADGSTYYVLNQLGGTGYTAAGGFADTDAFKNDAGNFWLLKETYNATKVAPVPAAAENIKMSLFDYGKLINSKSLNFLQNSKYLTDGLDGYTTDGSGTAPKMAKVLVDGYPYNETLSISYEYLFNPSAATITKDQYLANIYPASDNNVFADPYAYQMAAFPVRNSDGSGTGLFQKDSNGYYYYDSAMNAAWYNPASGRFELYDYVVRPPYITYSTVTSTSVGSANFTPFNQGHTTGYEDYGSYEEAGPVRPGDVTTPAYRLAGESQATDMNNWFGMALEFDFNMPAEGKVNNNEMIFDFHGDDDVYVYIDGVLVLDIGGTHGAQSGTINFATGAVTNPSTGSDNRLTSGTLRSIFADSGKYTEAEINEMFGDGDTFTDWSKHKLNFYYMERGGNISYCRLRFNMEPLPNGGARVTKQLTTDSVVTAETSNIDYAFKLVSVADDGVTETPVRLDGYTDANGIFKLKAGETLAFEELPTDNDNGANYGQLYRVYEMDDARYHVDYVTYSGNNDKDICKGVVSEEDGTVQYVEFRVRPDDHGENIIHSSVFVNDLTTTDFTVAKQVTGNLGDRMRNFIFHAKLYYDASMATRLAFPSGDGYEVQDNIAVFQLKHDESLTFENIPNGAYVEIIEVEEDYVTKFSIDDGSETEGRVAYVTTDLTANNDVVTFTNDKEVTIDTGIALDSIPYILILVGVAAVVGFLFLRKRRIED